MTMKERETTAAGKQEWTGADLEVGEELSSHDTLHQHVQVGAVLEAGHQVHHEAAGALRLNLLLPHHMGLHTKAAQFLNVLQMILNKHSMLLCQEERRCPSCEHRCDCSLRWGHSGKRQFSLRRVTLGVDKQASRRATWHAGRYMRLTYHIPREHNKQQV